MNLRLSSSSPRFRWRSALAFTLIEVMIAMSIFAMVMVVIYSSWSAIMKGSRSGLQAAAEVQRTRVTMQALEEALGSAIIYGDNLKYYAFFADTGGSFAWISFVARLPDSFPGSGLFKGQEVRRVSFEVNSDGALLLKQSPILEFLDKGQQPYTIKLVPKLSVFAMEFFDARKHDWVPEWGYTNQLPRMIRIGIGFGAKGASGHSENLTIRTVQMGATTISRIGGPGGLQPGAPGGIPPAGVLDDNASDQQQWAPSLPDTFNNRQGIDRNTIFQ